MQKVMAVVLMLCTFLFSSEVTVAVAANVSYAIKPLIETFKQTHPNTNVEVILGSSGKLLAQISHGAPYDLFLSANMQYPNRLYREGFTVGKPVIYAHGALALLAIQPHDFTKGLRVLEDASIHKIAIANPKTAPYGVATKEALEDAGLHEKLKKKFVYGESISQTVFYATSVADIGLVAKSSLFSPQMKKYKESKNWVDVDVTRYTPIVQGMVLLRRRKDNSDVRAFYDFMLSTKAQNILGTYGYKVP